MRDTLKNISVLNLVISQLCTTLVCQVIKGGSSLPHKKGNPNCPCGLNIDTTDCPMDRVYTLRRLK